MRPLSLDIRSRIVAAVDDGETVNDVAELYRVSRQTVYTLRKAHANGTLAPKKHPGNPTPRKLTPDVIAALRGWLEEKNDMTLKQIRERIKEEFLVTVSQKSIWTRMQALKMTWKKNGARSRTTARRRKAGQGSMASVGPIHPR